MPMILFDQDGLTRLAFVQNYVIENFTVFITSESSHEGYTRREGRRILLRQVEDVQRRFAEPVFGKSRECTELSLETEFCPDTPPGHAVLYDHSPAAYEDNLDWLAKAVLG